MNYSFKITLVTCTLNITLHKQHAGVTALIQYHAKIYPGPFWRVGPGGKVLILLPRTNTYHSPKVTWVYLA